MTSRYRNGADPGPSQMPRRLTTIIALTLALAACSAITGADLTTTTPDNAGTGNLPSGSTTATPPAVPGVAIVPAGGANLYDSPGGNTLQTIHENIALPITSTDGSWAEVVDPCSNQAWVNLTGMQLVSKSVEQSPGNGFDLARASVVVDAGHGGRDWGAPGPSGTRESNFNLDIADRLRIRLAQSNDVDWSTGAVTPGATYPRVQSIVMSRDTAGPDDGDFEAGLAYRAALANSLDADALLAIHNNTGADRTYDDPPRAVFYALSVPGSDRLASLIDEELFRGFDPFSDTWQGSAIQGTAARRDLSTGGDFYGLLRRSASPAVIIEGAFVSDPAQEQLLLSPEFRQAYADGVYRGLIRFLTTNETGSEINEPVDFDGNVGSPSTNKCVVPEQGG
ncbi:MAG TPA: N-acetylmuramoyl-L-alanine amidase [Acidimicrobiia bacterium]